MPPEYCKNARKDISECKKWLQETHPELFDSLYAEDPTAEKKELTEEEKAKLE